MKYDEGLFDLSLYMSKKFGGETQNDFGDSTISNEAHCLALILKKFQESLKCRDDVSDGILRVKFFRHFYNDDNDGYREIDEMIKNNKFLSFAKEYFIYVGDVRQKCDEYGSAYYELVWDYQTYFNQLKNSVPAKKRVSLQKNAWRNEQRAICKANGHDYGEWREVSYIEEVDVGPSGIEELFCGSSVEKIPRIKWVRNCKCCGCQSSVKKKPVEVKLKELLDKAAVLQKRKD